MEAARRPDVSPLSVPGSRVKLVQRRLWARQRGCCMRNSTEDDIIKVIVLMRCSKRVDWRVCGEFLDNLDLVDLFWCV